jgi:hypothetical protein
MAPFSMVPLGFYADPPRIFPHFTPHSRYGHPRRSNSFVFMSRISENGIPKKKGTRMKIKWARVGWLGMCLALQHCDVADSPRGESGPGPFRGNATEKAFPGKTGTVKKGILFGEPVDYMDVDGRAVIGGDVVMPAGSMEAQSAMEPSLAKAASVGRALGASRWINNVVYYRYHPSFTGAAKADAAIAHWEANTPLRFVQWTPSLSGHPDYIEFQSNEGDGCYSAGLGRMGGKQILNLDASCGDGNAIHEIGHAIGLYHEQCRSDQAGSIAIDLNNVSESDRGRFYAFNNPLRAPAPLDGTDFGAVDFGSIMMDGSYAFAIDTAKPVMTKAADGSTWSAQRAALSAGDVSGVTAMYPSIWNTVAGNGLDIGVGANGTAWIIGSTPVTGGYQIFKRAANATSWTLIAGGAVRVDADKDGNPWVINNGGQLFYYTTSWTGREQGLKFTDIGAGSNGSVYGVTQTASGAGYQMVRWTGSSWAVFASGGALRVTVDNLGNPWILNSAGAIQRWNGTAWETLPGSATDIGAGPDGSVYILETATVTGGQAISVWNGSAWRRIAGGGKFIDVGPGGNPWMVNASGAIFTGTLTPSGTVTAPPMTLPPPTGWQSQNISATDIGVGGTADNLVAWIISATDHPAGGRTIYRKSGANGSWTLIAGAAVAIDVDALGNPWVVNHAGALFYYNNGWIGREQGKQFVDIGAGGGSNVFGLVKSGAGPDYPVYKWTGSAWTAFPGASGVRITVDNSGYPWIATAAKAIQRWDGTAWVTVPGSARDLGAGPDGKVYAIGSDNVTGGGSVLSWNGTGWSPVSGGGLAIDLDPTGKAWMTDAQNNLYSRITDPYPGPVVNPPPTPVEPPVPPVVPPVTSNIWTLLPGTGDIVAFNGSTQPNGYAIDQSSRGVGGYTVRWFANGQATVIAKRFVDLDVGRDCEVWAVTDSGTVFFNSDACNSGSAWQEASGGSNYRFQKVAAGRGLNPGDPSIVYALTKEAVQGGYGIVKRASNGTWSYVSGGMIDIDADDDGSLWGADNQFNIAYLPAANPNPSLPGGQWMSMSGAGGHVGMGDVLAVGSGRTFAVSTGGAAGNLMAWTSGGWAYIVGLLSNPFKSMQVSPNGVVWATDDQHRIWYATPEFTPGPHPAPPGSGTGSTF